jgi:hypothetical protein
MASDRNTSAIRRIRWGAVLLILLLAMGACSDSATPTNITGTLPERTTQPPEETSPPEETQPPETEPPETQPPETEPPAETQPPTETTSVPAEEGDDSIPAWGWVVIGLGVIIVIALIVSAISGGRREPDVVIQQPATAPPAAAPPPATDTAWQQTARDAYGRARWLQSVMTSESAVQRGDSRFKQVSEMGEPTADEQSAATAWTQMEQTLRDTTFQLYGLETNPPTPTAGQTGAAVAGSLEALKRSLDNVVSAQVEYRRADTDEDADASAAYNRRMEAEAAARQARTDLDTSLTSLQTLI